VSAGACSIEEVLVAFIAEIQKGPYRYLAVKSSDGRRVLRWLGRDYSVADLKKAIKDFKIDLSRRRRIRKEIGRT